MAEELQVPHSLTSAVEVLRQALAESDSIEQVTVLRSAEHNVDTESIQLDLVGHLSDGARFTVTLEVS